MSLLHFRAKERRRTIRVVLTVPVTVHGQTTEGEKFIVHAQSHSVNRHGALLHMEEPVLTGQTLKLVNENSNRTAECRVVAIKRDRDGKTYVGVEFVSAESNFWHMTFPMAGAKPLRRISYTKASA